MALEVAGSIPVARPRHKTLNRFSLMTSVISKKSLVVPLCVDLDGTLIRTDVTQESLVLALAKKPWILFLLPLWLLHGRAYLKMRLSALVTLTPSRLPYNYTVIDAIEESRRKGAKVYLVTAAHETPARQIADYLGCFDDVWASDGTLNLRAEAKGNLLVQSFGEKGYRYMGNSHDDLMVWRYAQEAIAVNVPLNVRMLLDRMVVPTVHMEEGDFSWLNLLAVLSPFHGMIAGLMAMILSPWVGLATFALMTMQRLFRTMVALRQERVEPMGRLRIHMLLGHIPLSRAWLVLGACFGIFVYSLIKIIE